MIKSEIIIDQHYRDFSPMQFGSETCDPGHFFGPSVRTHWLLHYIVYGFGRFERDGISYLVKPGELLKPIIHCPSAGKIFEEMLQCEKMENGRTAFLCAKLWEFFSILLDNAKSDTDYVQKAINCINAEYINGITIQQVADRLNINRSYLSDLFKKRMGISPQKYLIQLRLEKAAELLTVYGQSPSTAGISVGYPDLYHFSKIFKKHFGVSPREYQKLNI